MKVPFNDLGPESRIWIYQSKRKLNKEEQEFITSNTEKFLTDWTAHGNDLQAGVQIFDDQFIIIGVNEAANEASGCSIDKSVGFIRELDKTLNLNLLDRSKVALKNEVGISLIEFSEIKNMISNGVINPDTKVYNHAIVSKSELENGWLKPARESWIKRFFN